MNGPGSSFSFAVQLFQMRAITVQSSLFHSQDMPADPNSSLGPLGSCFEAIRGGFHLKTNSCLLMRTRYFFLLLEGWWILEWLFVTMMYCSTCWLAADSCDICLAFTDSLALGIAQITHQVSPVRSDPWRKNKILLVFQNAGCWESFFNKF